jgi:hypothetical protein
MTTKGDMIKNKIDALYFFYNLMLDLFLEGPIFEDQ